MKMRKQYLYAVCLAVMALMMWIGSYYYGEYCEMEYKNGTLVQVPIEKTAEPWELAA